MAITREEYLAKKQIMDKLSREGYPTYAHLLDLFDLHLTNDPKVVGFMIPDQGVIVLNRNLDIQQVCTIVRHEILHEYLSHQLRMQRHLGLDKYNNRDATIHQLINIAGDYEISNRGYTEKDKDIVRGIRLNGEILKGLVTEDDHPDWVDLTIEEMFDKLYQEYQDDMEALKPLLDMIQKLNQQTDKDIEKAEEIEREANDISSQLSSSDSSMDSDQDSDSNGNSSSSKSSDKKEDDAKKADQIAKAAKDAADELKDQKDNNSDDSKSSKSSDNSKTGGPAKSSNDDANVFTSEEDREKQIKISKRLEKIEKAFNELKDNLEQEDNAKIQRDRALKADKELKAYKADPFHKFQASLSDFIKKAVSIKRDYSWSRPNRRYGGTGILAQGKAIKPNPIPLINVYYDQSGSWSSSDIAMGNKAIDVLKNYIQQGKIKVKLYYFSNNVHGDAMSARREGGTEGQPILDHIRATHPDNVVVLTDSDISDCRTPTKVPGAVWFLWKNGDRSDNLINNLKGEKKTEMFDLKM